MKCLDKIYLTLFEDELPDLIKSTEFVRQFVKQTEGTSGQPSILTPKILKRSPKRKIKELEMQVDPIPLHLVEMIEQAKVKLGSSK